MWRGGGGAGRHCRRSRILFAALLLPLYLYALRRTARVAPTTQHKGLGENREADAAGVCRMKVCGKFLLSADMLAQ